MKLLKIVTLATVLSASSLVQADGNNTDLTAEAPAFVIMLDNSGSSPATNQQTVNEAWVSIERKLKQMPLNSEVSVFTVGDASAPPFRKTSRIQTKTTYQGDTRNAVISQTKKMITEFPELIKSNAIPPHGRSELVGGFFDAAQLLNPKSDKNEIIFISDLIENSDLANCYKPKKCQLPPPQFSLHGTEVTVLGVGMGLPSEEAMAISSAWGDFLKQAGAKQDPPPVLSRF